jgi:hypothetical protein
MIPLMFAWLVGPKREIRNLTLDLDVNISETVGESDFFLPDRILFCDFLFPTGRSFWQNQALFA